MEDIFIKMVKPELNKDSRNLLQLNWEAFLNFNFLPTLLSGNFNPNLKFETHKLLFYPYFYILTLFDYKLA